MFGIRPPRAARVSDLHVPRLDPGRAILLVDALDEAQDGPSKNDVVRMLQLLGKGVNAGLGVVVTMRPDPEVNIRILKHAWGAEHAMEVAPTQLRGEAAAAGIFLKIMCVPGLQRENVPEHQNEPPTTGCARKVP